MTERAPRKQTLVHDLERYLQSHFGKPIEIVGVRPLGKDGGDKEYGYGVPLRVELRGAPVSRVVLHTISRRRGGHDTLADRTSQALLAWETFNDLPRHARALDVGVVLDDGDRLSIARAREAFYLTEYAEGSPYFTDLDRIAATGAVTDMDRHRVDALAALLARIHGKKRVDRDTYVRKLRQLVGHDECISGLIDTYDAVDLTGYVSRERLVAIEQRAVAWRHALKEFHHRLARVHGDFHPWNILFHEGGDVPTLLDRSRGAFGDPADDVSALVINFLVHALHRDGGVRGPFAELWTRFFRAYLGATRDDELARVLPPFLAFRALVLASPVWYPHFTTELRARIFSFIESILAADRFDFDAPERWMPEGA